ncbi:MAG: protein kinase [Myxococcales bacterium]|nr:protein kinase [Myxococcales bacterium]
MATRLSQQVPTGTIIGGRYRIDRLLGEGGFASVYLAHHIELDTPVALKRMHGQHLTRDDLQGRFRIEARTAAALESRHTVRVRDFGIDTDGAPFMVLDLVRGKTLEDMLAETGPMPEALVGALALGVLASLAEASEHGVVHRDIKPANIFLAELKTQGQYIAKVSDFGIAKLLEAGPDQATRTADGVMCTPLYAAPEMLLRSAAPASDLYALGHMMAELLDGTAPYFHENAIVSAAKHLSSEPVPLGQKTRESVLGPVVERAVQKDLTRRYQSATEMAAAIRAAFAAIGESVSAEIPPDMLGPASTHLRARAPRPTGRMNSKASTPILIQPPDDDRGRLGEASTLPDAGAIARSSAAGAVDTDGEVGRSAVRTTLIDLDDLPVGRSKKPIVVGVAVIAVAAAVLAAIALSGPGADDAAEPTAAALDEPAAPSAAAAVPAPTAVPAAPEPEIIGDPPDPTAAPGSSAPAEAAALVPVEPEPVEAAPTEPPAQPADTAATRPESPATQAASGRRPTSSARPSAAAPRTAAVPSEPTPPPAAAAPTPAAAPSVAAPSHPTLTAPTPTPAAASPTITIQTRPSLISPVEARPSLLDE